MRDRPGPRLLASLGAAVAATSLAAALVLVIRRMQVPFDTSGLASILALMAGVTLVILVDAASTGAGVAARTLQRVAVRLGLGLTLAATLPRPAALLAPHERPLWGVAIAVAVAAAVIAMIAPIAPWLGRRPEPASRRGDGGRRHGGEREPFPTSPRRRRRTDRVRRRSATEPSPPATPPAAEPTLPGASHAALDVPTPPPAGVIQQRFERYLLPDERMECLRGTLHLAVVAGSRLVTGHVGFCPPFHQLPQVEVGTACEEVEATITAAEVLPWGVRVECRLDEPADETILFPIDIVARAPLPAIDDSPPSPPR